MSPTLTPPAIIMFAPGGAPRPGWLTSWLESQRSPVLSVESGDDLMAIGLRSRPRLVVFATGTESRDSLAACSRLKRDSYTGVVPALVLSKNGAPAVREAFDAGADEVLSE